MNELALKIYNFIHETQLLGAVILGMIIQYMFSTEKTARGIFLILIATLFTVWFIMPMIIDLINIFIHTLGVKFQIAHDSKIAGGIYAMSTLVSVELIAIIINFLPKLLRHAVKKRISQYFGVKRDDYDE